MTLTPAEIRQKRAEAQKIAVTVHIGKGGVTETVIAELRAQLESRKLVKVRLLPSSKSDDADGDAQAEALAAATQSTLVDRRGHTAVFWHR